MYQLPLGKQQGCSDLLQLGYAVMGAYGRKQQGLQLVYSIPSRRHRVYNDRRQQ